jgi:hypothetical protein
MRRTISPADRNPTGLKVATTVFALPALRLSERVVAGPGQGVHFVAAPVKFGVTGCALRVLNDILN